MIESYGKFTSLDGTEFPYTDFRGSRREAAAKAEARDKTIIATREEQKGRPLTIRESLEPATRQTKLPSEPIAQSGANWEATAAETEGIKPPYPLTAPERELTPAEESAKKAFMEMHVAAARAQQAKKAHQTTDAQPSSNHNI